MTRIVSVWLPRWPVLRFLAAQKRNPPHKPIDPERPFILSVDGPGGPRIAALNEAAESLGLLIGEPLADARAKVGELQVHPIDPAADDVALRRLALWATRYTPAVSPWGEKDGGNGFFLEVAGAAHLFGGEEALLDDLAQRLHHFGLPARLAIADTAGAAWALSRYHPAPLIALPSGSEADALASLPIDALRLLPETRATLRRLGFKRVGALIDKPRAPFAARFERELLQRLDQALGRVIEPLAWIAPLPVYHSLRYLLEPVFTQQAVVAIARRLMQDITHVLVRDGVGARCLRLALYRVDGAAPAIDIGLTLPTRDVAHVARLIDLKLERLAGTLDAGFGFEAVGLAVITTGRMEEQQTELAAVSDGTHDAARCAALVDTLCQRLGPSSVRRLAPVASHIPERAEVSCTASPSCHPGRRHRPRAGGADPGPKNPSVCDWSQALGVMGPGARAVRSAGMTTSCPTPDEAQTGPRPLFILPRAEPTEVTALVPEGPPRRFNWRGATYGVTRTQGPERIANEWWHDGIGPTRDYYVVEDEVGHRFWLYREGLYGRETAAPRWFVHGLFA
jgi:protein ImuB